MESSLVRTVAAAFLPSERALRIGSGRLSVAALPGHDAVVLAGRRVGTGHGGVRFAMAMGPAARNVMVACAKPGSDAADEKVEWESLKDFDRMHREISETLHKLPGSFPPPPAAPLSKEEKALQQKLKEIAERSVALNADAMARLPPAQLIPFVPVAMIVHQTFGRVAVAAKEGCANPGMAVVVADALEVVRRVVSYTLKTHLQLHGPSNPTLYLPQLLVFGLERNDATNNFEEAWVAVLDNVYKNVEEDINRMISSTI